MKKPIITLIILVLLIAGCYGIWSATKPKADVEPQSSRGGSRGPASVKVEPAKVQPMPIMLEAVGTVEAEHSVSVLPQISGVLQEILFREGDLVRKGQLLFRVDARTLEAQLAQAKAAQARDQAQLTEAEALRNRLAPLAEKSYVTRREFDEAAAAAKAAAATVAADKAVIQQAQVQLGYSRIYAPITGRTGALAVKSGNLVSNGGDPLVVINQIQPVLVSFTVPQRQLDVVRRWQNGGPLLVEIRREGDATILAEGKLHFIDNNVNAQTGTVLLKARIPNQDERLWPGQFVDVRLILAVEPNAVVVPEAAVQMGQQGSFVYVVENGKAKIQPVRVARQVKQQVVIAQGLRGGEPVITEIPQNLAAGSEVKIRGQGGGGNEKAGKPSQKK